MRKIVLTLILAAACAGAAVAAPERVPFDAQAVITQQQQIRADIEAKRGAYGKLDIATRQEVRERQDKLLELLNGRSYEQLSADEQDQARLHMAWIEYAGKQDDDRLVCERIRTTGSNRVERVCKTVAQRREEKAASKKNADSVLQGRGLSPCGPDGCQ
ncbi:hypothetical protein ABU614_10550 [Lysobacter firmicutimachus]|uniref:DUF1311 domain-containing protein n=1 Tax=Lysobacter firmicutimachus TaxID=1792846 RepID=A0AAU8N0S5_9GAMM|nr:hypothetical protein [Lysobacter antibioticus]